jgi:opacity protein-like surface antigen
MINAKSQFDWSVAMRRLFLAAVMMGAVSTAHAADLPVLRGGITDPLSSTSVNWQGFYFGGQVGYGSSDANLTGSTATLAKKALANNIIDSQMGVSNWDLALGRDSSRTTGYGAFGGYNWQWTDAVLSFEASYLHGNFGGSSTASQALRSTTPLSDGFYHSVKAVSSSSISISDMATIRGRAAYSFGCFLPYAFGGFALGNADINQNFTAFDGVSVNPLGPFTSLLPSTASNDLHNHLIYGYTGGVGMDVSLTAGLFLRAEWEYVRFTTKVDTTINTARAGVGYKF